MPKSSNVSLVESAAFTALIRASIAYSYALGAHMMVPCEPPRYRWHLGCIVLKMPAVLFMAGDIYLPTPHAARYFGNASTYGDLFHFVRRHGELLDATTTLLEGTTTIAQEGEAQLRRLGACPP